MDSYEWNKVFGAVLGTGVFVMGLGFISDLVFSTTPPDTPGYLIEVAEAAPTAEGAAAPAAVPLPVLLASANPSKGENVAKKCGACHSFEKGGPNKVGPDLYGIVGEPIGDAPGFSFSQGMQAYAAADKTWTFEHLNAFISNPRGTVPGTAMSFAGIKNDQERADLLVYLRSLSDDPKPLPPVEEASAEATEPAAAEPAAAAETVSPPPADVAPAPTAPAQVTPAPSETPAAAPAAPAAPDTPVTTPEAPATPAAEPEAPAAPAEPAAPAAPAETPAAPAEPAVPAEPAPAQ